RRAVGHAGRSLARPGRYGRLEGRRSGPVCGPAPAVPRRTVRLPQVRRVPMGGDRPGGRAGVDRLHCVMVRSVTMMRRKMVFIAALTVTLLAFPWSGEHAAGAPTHSGKFKIVLSNNYMGNEWRPQMENVAKFISRSSRYKG